MLKPDVSICHHQYYIFNDRCNRCNFWWFAGRCTGNWAANVVTISGTPTASGTFNYTVTSTGGCGTITATGSITVTPNNTISLHQQQEQITRQYVIISNYQYYIFNNRCNRGNFQWIACRRPGQLGGECCNHQRYPTAHGTFNYTVTTTGGCTIRRYCNWFYLRKYISCCYRCYHLPGWFRVININCTMRHRSNRLRLVRIMPAAGATVGELAQTGQTLVTGY